MPEVIFVDSYGCPWFMVECNHCGEIRPVIKYPRMLWLCYPCLKEGGNKGEPPYREVPGAAMTDVEPFDTEWKRGYAIGKSESEKRVRELEANVKGAVIEHLRLLKEIERLERAGQGTHERFAQVRGEILKRAAEREKEAQ
jgi:ribosomal protein S14